MKHFLWMVALLMLGLSSCKSSYPYYQSVGYLDYSQFAKEGIYLTEANSVSFDYEPLGSVSATLRSGYKEGERVSKFQYTDMMGQSHKTEKYSKWTHPTCDDALRLVAECAKEQGANGVINLKTQTYTTLLSGGKESITIVATGMAIKK